MSRNSNKKTLVPLFLVLVIDEMGMGLILPVMSVLFLSTTHGFFSADTSVFLRDFLYGFTLVCFFLFMFFGAPILGDLSDKYGRKKIIICCLLLTAVSYLISVLGIGLKSPTLLLVGRALAGFMAGSLPIAQAAIADISTPENKARNMSLITLACCLGFVLGPLSGGYFSENELVSVFGYQTPFYFAAALALLNVLGLVALFKETYPLQVKKRIVLFRGWQLFTAAFQNERLKKVALLFLLTQFGWGLYFQFISLYLVEQYHYSATYIGWFMGYLGICFFISLTLLIRPVLKRMSVAQANAAALLLGALAFAVNIVFPAQWVLWVTAFPACMAMSIAYTCQITLFSESVDKTHQGWVMGVSASVMAVGWVFSGLLTSLMGILLLWVPFLLATLAFAYGAWLQHQYFKAS